MRQRFLALLTIAVLAGAATATAQSFPIDLPVELSGRVADSRHVVRGDYSEYLKLHLDRLTPEETVAKLAGVSAEEGRNAVAAAVSELPTIGWIQVGNGLRFDVKTARSALVDGEWVVRLLTATPLQIAPGQRVHNRRQYPFGAVELRLGADATGQGDLIAATDAVFGRHGDIELEPYPEPAFRVLSVRRSDEP